MIRRLKDDYPYSNIVAIDYDPGATKINQENRIKLMLANAKGLVHAQAQPDPSHVHAVPQMEREEKAAPAQERESA